MILFVLAAPGVLAASPVAEAVARAAREHLLEEADRAGLSDPVVTLQVRADARGRAVCSGVLEVEVVDARHPTRMRFAATCRNGESWRDEFVVRGELSAQVAVATAQIKAGRPIAAAEIALERRAVTSPEAVSSSLDAVVGLASRRALRAGQVVDRRTLAEPILVQRGAAVAIVARNGPVQVTTAGEALAPGRAGDIVEVRNIASGRVIRARVTASNVVEPADMVPMAPSPQSVR